MRRPGPPQPSPCEVCDAALAPHGYTIRYEEEDGTTRTVTLWFCGADRQVGEDLWRASRLREAPSRLMAERAPVEPPRQGALL